MCFAPPGSTIQSWLKEQGKTPNSLPPNDVVTFFDNNQVIGRNYGVSMSKAPQSVITTTVHMASKHDERIQNNEECNPAKWLQSFELNDANKVALSNMVAEAEKLLG